MALTQGTKNDYNFSLKKNKNCLFQFLIFKGNTTADSMKIKGSIWIFSSQAHIKTQMVIKSLG